MDSIQLQNEMVEGLTQELCKVIENYEACVFSKLHVSKDRMAEILYKNIQQNDNLFVELFKGGRYPRQECEFTGNDTWALIEQCVHILVQKQTCE